MSRLERAERIEREPQRPRRAPIEEPARPGASGGTGTRRGLSNQQVQSRLARREREGSAALDRDATEAAEGLESLILPDVGPQGATGGMRKRAFLELLESEVTRAAEQELRGTGRTTEGCPWIAYWFRYYERRDAAHLARAIEKYAPEAASAEQPEDVVALVRERVRDGVRRSVRSGTIEDLPPGIPLEAFAPGSEASVPVGEPPTDPFGLTPEPVRSEAAPTDAAVPPAATPADAARTELGLGAGEPLDARTRSRMESAFRTDLSDVRVHSDAAGQTAAGRRSAQAFAYGSDVAMAPQRYAPGTPTGDALLAHELAHVIQQRPARRSAEATTTDGPATPNRPATSAFAPHRAVAASSPAASGRAAATTASAPLETDADRSAEGAVRSLWGGGSASESSIDARPTRTSALQVSSCDGKTDDPTVAKSVDVKPITLFESTGNPTADVTFGNTTVWNQANLTLSQQPTQTVNQTETERLIDSDHEVDTVVGAKSEEDEAILAQFGSENVIPIVYVKTLIDVPGRSRAGTTNVVDCGDTTVIMVENGLSGQGVNHEVGHALGLTHRPADNTNLMFPTALGTNTNLDADQKTTVRTSHFAH